MESETSGSSSTNSTRQTLEIVAGTPDSNTDLKICNWGENHGGILKRNCAGILVKKPGVHPISNW
jgi:hypothetical protein